MAAFVTVDATGATKALAYAFLQDETEQSFQWAFESFKDAFRVSPAFIFTDSDPAMALAIAAAFPDAKHLLCVWHLSKNMFQTVKAACGDDNALWLRMLSAWWLIVKQSDESSRTTFDEEWARLSAMLDASKVTGKSMEAARAWLAKMAERREMWAYRWTWQCLTLGIHSTQRIESLHSHVMGYLRANMLLVNLVPALESFGSNVAIRAETRDYRHLRLEQSARKMNAHPLIDKYVKIMHPFALNLLKAQLQLAAYYQVSTGDGEGAYSVTRLAPVDAGAFISVEDDGDDADVGLDTVSFAVPRVTTINKCSCQFPNAYGVACRHILRLCEVTQQPVPETLFCSRWHYVGGERIRTLVEELRRRQPARTAPAAALSSRDRFALVMQHSRVLADLGGADATLYRRAREGLAQLISDLRSPAAAPAAARATLGRAGSRGAAAAPLAEVEEGGRALEQCRACWGFGHRSTNRTCTRFKLAPLPKPADVARAPAVTLRRKRVPMFDDDEEEAEEAAAEEEDSHENVCHGCGETGELYCCSACPHAWCDDCITLEARSGLHGDDWRCAICTGAPLGRTIGNPRQPPQKGAKARARKRAKSDLSPGAERASRRAVRAKKPKELRYR